jgi:hypothetical protein
MGKVSRVQGHAVARWAQGHTVALGSSASELDVNCLARCQFVLHYKTKKLKRQIEPRRTRSRERR